MNNIVGALTESELMNYGSWSDGECWINFPRVAFIGDSITYGWDLASHFKNPINAGIPGNTTQQMQERFLVDVVLFNPQICHILGGINDIAHIPGATTHWIEWITDYCSSHGIKIILGTLLPNTVWNDVYTTWEDGNAAILAWNNAIKLLGKRNGWPVIDYYPHFLNSDGSQNSSLFLDGLHPNSEGGSVMASVGAKVFSAI